MEDALAPANALQQGWRAARLNPCFNGRCTRTKKSIRPVLRLLVLILVLMEDALALLFTHSIAYDYDRS